MVSDLRFLHFENRHVVGWQLKFEYFLLESYFYEMLLCTLDFCGHKLHRITWLYLLSWKHFSFQFEYCFLAVDVEKDFVNYKLADYGILPGRDDIFSFMSHPFILGTKQKTIYLFYDSRVKQIQLRNRARFGMVLAGGNDISSIPYCIIKVSRQNLIRKSEKKQY